MAETKKIFDILPPKSNAFFQTEVPLSTSKEDVFQVAPEEKKGQGIKIRALGRKKGLIFTMAVLFFLGVSFHFFGTNAEVEIWPETELLNFSEKITADSEVKNLTPNFWLKNKAIPAEFFMVENTASGEFPASGKILEERKAEGTIRVYNNYSTSSQSLIAKTRFVSANGKLFRTPERVVIPGGEYEKGKFVPGFLDIKVEADSPGPEYNIDSSTFSIPGFAGTPKYTAFYGKSFSSMEGGFRGEVAKVTEENLKQAKDTLTGRLFEENDVSLKDKISPDFIVLEEGQTQEIIEESCDVTAGAEKNSFNYQVKVKSQALAFKKTDLENFVKEFIITGIDSEDKKLHEESLLINYQLETINWEAKKISLWVEFSVRIYSNLDHSALAETLGKKSVNEAQWLLTSQPEIIKAKIKLSPFWLKKVPENKDKIKIKLNFE